MKKVNLVVGSDFDAWGRKDGKFFRVRVIKGQKLRDLDDGVAMDTPAGFEMGAMMGLEDGSSIFVGQTDYDQLLLDNDALLY